MGTRLNRTYGIIGDERGSRPRNYGSGGRRLILRRYPLREGISPQSFKAGAVTAEVGSIQQWRYQSRARQTRPAVKFLCHALLTVRTACPRKASGLTETSCYAVPMIKGMGTFLAAYERWLSPTELAVPRIVTSSLATLTSLVYLSLLGKSPS